VKIRSGAPPATRLLGSKLFDCCSRHQCAVVSGAPATTRLTPREAPGWRALRSRARRGNSRIPGGTKPCPSSLLDIGFGDASARAPLFACWQYSRFLSRGIGAHPPNSGRKAGSLITAEISLIANLHSLQGRQKFPVLMRRELARKDLVWRLFLLPLTRCGASNR
jgi:hypothetical protein